MKQRGSCIITFSLLFLLFFSMGCSTLKRRYSFNLGTRIEDRSERYPDGLDTAFSNSSGRNVTTTSGNNTKLSAPGYTGYIGLIEDVETGFTSEVNFFYTKYSDFAYEFNIQGEGTIRQQLSSSAWGLEGKLGYLFGVFRPHVSYRWGRLSVESEVTSGTASPVIVSASGMSFTIGGGFALIFPLGKSGQLLIQGDYLFPLNEPSEVSTQIISSQIGVSFFLFETK